MFTIQTKPSIHVLRQFAAAWLVFFLLLAANQIWRRGHIPAGRALAVVALIGIIGLIKPNALRWLYVAASVVAFPIGWVVSQIMLAVLFYVVVTPMGFFWRGRGRDVLQLRPKKQQSTFWITRDTEPPPERYLKQF